MTSSIDTGRSHLRRSAGSIFLRPSASSAQPLAPDLLHVIAFEGVGAAEKEAVHLRVSPVTELGARDLEGADEICRLLEQEVRGGRASVLNGTVKQDEPEGGA